MSDAKPEVEKESFLTYIGGIFTDVFTNLKNVVGISRDETSEPEPEPEPTGEPASSSPTEPPPQTGGKKRKTTRRKRQKMKGGAGKRSVWYDQSDYQNIENIKKDFLNCDKNDAGDELLIHHGDSERDIIIYRIILKEGGKELEEIKFTDRYEFCASGGKTTKRKRKTKRKVGGKK